MAKITALARARPVRTSKAAMEGSVGQARRHQRDKGAVRTPAKRGRSVLWELVG